MSVLVDKNQPQSVFQNMTKSGIKMICFINKRGRMTELTGDDLGVPKSKKEMFLMKIALRTAMQKDFDEDLGEVSYCMTQRGNRKFISIPTSDNNTILAVTKKKFDHEKLVKNIYQMLNSDQFLGVTLKEGVT